MNISDLREEFIRSFIENTSLQRIAEAEYGMMCMIGSLPLEGSEFRLEEASQVSTKNGYRRFMLILRECIPSELTFECRIIASHGTQCVMDVENNDAGRLIGYVLACGHVIPAEGEYA